MVLTVKVPGRVVLFGEHQDYLGLPVIPAAIDLFMTIKGNISNSDHFRINLPDIQDVQFFSAIDLSYKSDRDYLRAGVKVLQQNEIIPMNKGVTATITSGIPMQAGLSSSSAMCIGWVSFLSELFENSLTSMEITKLAHQAEVLEFNEPGGMQDHMAVAHGYVNYEEFDPIRCTRLLEELPGIVIGNSLEKKDTLNTLSTIRNAVKKGLDYMKVSKVRELTIDDINDIKPDEEDLDSFSLGVLQAAVINSDITKKAHLELQKSTWDVNYIGNLINSHHMSLRDHLKVSTSKIEIMIQAAKKAGAIGCKITGSGNGGCMIAFCPNHEESVKKAILRAGGDAHIAQVVPGVSKVE